MPNLKPITDAERAARRKAQSAARHAKRQAQWNSALAEAGWTESQYMTAVIRKRVQLPKQGEREMFVNCSERYGSQAEVTVDDYKQLNPQGRFEKLDYVIIEHLEGGYTVVATKKKQ